MLSIMFHVLSFCALLFSSTVLASWSYNNHYQTPTKQHVATTTLIASLLNSNSNDSNDTTTSILNNNSNNYEQATRQVTEAVKIDPNLQYIVNSTESPKSDKQRVLDMFHKFFTKARSHDDLQQKEFVRDGIIMRLRELGFETSFLQKSRFEFRRRPAFSYNMISILPGKFRQTKKDRIILVGAHWDSATKAPGVDDNGSGSTCLLEIARLISDYKCSFNHTVMLVWFDYEEQGKYGSEFFVNDYLFPLEIEKYNSKFIGAYILDMILVKDKENNTQSLPLNLKTRLTDFSDELEREKFRGDFLATWSRKIHDEPLEDVFRTSWIDLGFESRTFKSMRPDLPQSRLPNAEERYEWKDFFRSDHASFWFPPLTSTAVRRSPNRTSTVGHTSLNAILLTDLGPWRKSYQKCYHSACDDDHLLTDSNLAFMQQVIDSLVLTLLRIGQGQCSNYNNQLTEAVAAASTAVTVATTSTSTTTTVASTTTTTTTPIPTPTTPVVVVTRTAATATTTNSTTSLASNLTAPLVTTTMID